MNCAKLELNKYKSRPGPPYPAQNCKNSKKNGNDGLLYISLPDKNGIYKWKKFSSSSKKSRKKSKKKSKKKYST